mmetsp:Transcript_6492/g.26043  ORF Transcript_6492/g.26043 Transcript_6492/m.26043 type:complete len:241 (+) Transcript_6492:206-928(+)
MFSPCAEATVSTTATPAGRAWTRVEPKWHVSISLVTAMESVARTGVPPNVQPLAASTADMYDCAMDVNATRVCEAEAVEPVGKALVESHSSKHGVTQRSTTPVDSASGDSHMINALETTTPPETPAPPPNTHSDFAEAIVPSTCVDMRFDPVIDITSTGPQVWRGCAPVTAWSSLTNKIAGGSSDAAAASRANRTTTKPGDRSAGVGQCTEGATYVPTVAFKFPEPNTHFKVPTDNVPSC